MAFLQAVVDDSASEVGDKRLFLAGYLNTAEKWALFSAAWAEELRSRKPIEYLRMVEANNLRGEFKGWTEAERDEKLRGLMRVARHFEPFSFHTSVSRKRLAETLKPTSPRGLASGHFLCCFNIVSSVARYAANERIQIPIEFIFDQQDGVEDDMNLFFDYMKRNLPRKARKLISQSPIFKDDKLYLPLQAADLLVWHLRRNHETKGSWDAKGPVMNLLNAKVHLYNELDGLISTWANKFDKLMPDMGPVQSKPGWRKMKQTIRDASAGGFVPPYGTPLRNLIFVARDRLRWWWMSRR